MVDLVVSSRKSVDVIDSASRQYLMYEICNCAKVGFLLPFHSQHYRCQAVPCSARPGLRYDWKLSAYALNLQGRKHFECVYCS
jgi:hypothetical protein